MKFGRVPSPAVIGAVQTLSSVLSEAFTLVTFVYVLPGMPAAAMLAGNWLVQQRRLGNAVDQVLSVGILITLLITSLLMGRLAFHEGEPFHMERRSAKALVMVYDRAKANPDMPAAALPNEKSKQSNAPLIFVGVRPFSAHKG